MWKLTIEDDQGNKTVVNLVRDEYTIGRAEQNAVRLTERNISRNHARVFRTNEQWALEDLNSYNGCYVNGVRVGDPQPLQHGDLIQLGDYRLEIVDDTVAVVDDSTGEPSEPSMPRSQSLLGQPDRLVMLVGPTPGAEYQLLGERVVIGRGEECDVPINHTSVSRVHAEIRAAGNGRYELIDRESANGVRVNGVELQKALIDARDMIELGDVVLKFIPAGQIYLPGAEESQQLGAYGFVPADRVSSAPGVEARPAPSGLPTGVKIVGGIVMLALLAVLGFVATLGGNNNTAATASSGNAVDPTVSALERAKALLAKGDFEGAHQIVISEIPENSNARQSEDFKHIEARWADSLLAQADTEQDPAKKRELLDRVAKATTVDSVRRKRASSEMEALDNQVDGVAVTELPNVPRVVKTEDKPKPESTSGGLVRTNPFDSPGPTAHKAAPKPSGTTASSSTASVKDQATSGDRAKQIASKNALKAKVARGQASDQEKRLLRALCRATGDMSCAY
jgi:pSer/pThr/pTyr-binding forkhead associated (FHA) protein